MNTIPTPPYSPGAHISVTRLDKYFRAQKPRTVSSTVFRIFAIVAATLFSGCATHALWEPGTFARFHEPATPPALELYTSADGQKTLVVYSEEVDSEKSRGKRAYWIDPKQPAAENPFRPKFV